VIYTANGSPALFALDSYFQVTGPATIALTELTYPTGAWDAGWTSVGADYVYVAAGTNPIYVGVADGIVIDHILLHCEGEGDVTVLPLLTYDHGGSLDFDFNEPVAGAGVTIHQIPEPFTMVLLGLGGLVTLRRRR